MRIPAGCSLAGFLIIPAVLFSGQACVTQSVPVRVAGRSETLVKNLRASDFHVELNGKTLTVLAAEHHQGPSRSVILMDISSSIFLEQDFWSTAVRLAGEFTELAPPTLKIALFTFSQHTESRTAFLDDRDALRRSLRLLDAAAPQRKRPRQTAIVDGLMATISAVTPRQFGDSIVLITDGDDNASEHDEAHVTELLLASGMRLFVLVIDTRMSRHPIRQETYDWLSRVARTTGGDLLSLFPRQDSRPRLQNLLQMMTDIYRLDVDVCEPLTGPARWKIVARESAWQRSRKPERLRLWYPAAIAPGRPQ